MARTALSKIYLLPLALTILSGCSVAQTEDTMAAFYEICRSSGGVIVLVDGEETCETSEELENTDTQSAETLPTTTGNEQITPEADPEDGSFDDDVLADMPIPGGLIELDNEIYVVRADECFYSEETYQLTGAAYLDGSEESVGTATVSFIRTTDNRFATTTLLIGEDMRVASPAWISSSSRLRTVLDAELDYSIDGSVFEGRGMAEDFSLKNLDLLKLVPIKVIVDCGEVSDS